MSKYCRHCVYYAVSDGEFPCNDCFQCEDLPHFIDANDEVDQYDEANEAAQ